jgi:hypothetical protein
MTIEPVPISPAHRRNWRRLWRRCSCGLPAPCVDRRLAAMTATTSDRPHRPGEHDPLEASPPAKHGVAGGRPGMAYRQMTYTRR